MPEYSSSVMMPMVCSRRRLQGKAVLFGALAFGGPTLLGSCVSSSGGSYTSSSTTLARLRDAGAVNVGIANAFPFDYIDQAGRSTGEAVEVARAIMRKLGIEQFNPIAVESQDLLPGLRTRQFDLVTAGLNITPARCRLVDFSTPDFTAPSAFMVPRGNPAGISSFDQVRDQKLRLAVLAGGLEGPVAAQNGIPATQIRQLPDQQALLEAVRTSQADCAALSDIGFRTLMARNPGAPVEITRGFFPIVNGRQIISAGAFALRPGDDLLEPLNAGLRAIQRSGEWLRITQPFGLGPENLPSPDLTVEAVCASQNELQ